VQIDGQVIAAGGQRPGDADEMLAAHDGRQRRDGDLAQLDVAEQPGKRRLGVDQLRRRRRQRRDARAGGAVSIVVRGPVRRRGRSASEGARADPVSPPPDRDMSGCFPSLPASVNFLRRHRGKLFASLLITLGIWATLHKGGLKIVPEGGDFRSVHWWVVPCYAVTLGGVTWFRSVRWRFLLRGVAEVPKKRLLAVSCVGFAAILLMPFRIGEFVRPYLIRTRPEELRPGERPISMTAATSSVVAERVIDGLYISIVLAFALLFVATVEPLPDRVVGLPVSVQHVRMMGYAMLGFFGVLFVTIAVFYLARSWAHRTTLLVFGTISQPLAEKLAATAEKLADGLHVFGRGRDLIGFVFETTLYWGLNVGGMWLLAWGCGVVHADGAPLTLGEACALMGMLSPMWIAVAASPPGVSEHTTSPTSANLSAT
jgi:hypothetical protein